MDEELERSFEKMTVATSTPNQVREIICLEDVVNTTPTTSVDDFEEPTIAAAAEPTTNNNQIGDDEMMDYPEQIPEDLEPIKEFIQHTGDDDYIPLMSAITLKKKKRMLFLPLDFAKITIDALVDSGAYINVISENDADKIREQEDNPVVKEAPPPPFKIQYANTALEKPLATYTMKFKIGNYTFEETFIVMTQSTYPIIGLAFLRKHAAILDTAHGTIDFPKIQITLALKDEMQKCNPKPITIRTGGKHTIPANATKTIFAAIAIESDKTITGTIQPLPQYDETAKLIVAPAITTAREKKIAVKVANTTDFPYTIRPNTKIAELQILKPSETKNIRPLDVAALNLLKPP